MLKYQKIIAEAKSDLELNKLSTSRNTFNSDNIVELLTTTSAKKEAVALKPNDELFLNLFDITPSKKPDPSGLPLLIKKTELDNTKISFKTSKTELVDKLPVDGKVNEYTSVTISDLINTIATITKGTFNKDNKREIFLQKLGSKTGPFYAPQILARVVIHNGAETTLRLFKEERDVDTVVPIATITVDRVSLIELFQNGVLVQKQDVNGKGIASALSEVDADKGETATVSESKKVDDDEDGEEPTLKDKMVKLLKTKYGSEADKFDIEAAIYWFASDYHSGQTSELYSILSTSKYKPGAKTSSAKDEGELVESMYEDLEAKFK